MLQREKLFSPFFILSVILIIPLLLLGIYNGNKLRGMFISPTHKYAITKAILLTNHNRKYNNHASYRFNNGGKTYEGSDGGMLWAIVGDPVTIYYETGHMENNGILSNLLFIATGQWLATIFLGSYIIYKIVNYARQP